MRKLSISIVILALVLVTSSALADNMDDALDAANFGDYEKARNLWLIEAEKGSAVAQANIGLLYEDGLGVPQSDKEAVKWYRMAAEQGEPRGPILFRHGLRGGPWRPSGLPRGGEKLSSGCHSGICEGPVQTRPFVSQGSGSHTEYRNRLCLVVCGCFKRS